MKKLLIAAGLLAGSTVALADPGLLAGISYNFGGSVGFTIKALSSDHQDEPVASIGLSFFPWSETHKFGLDLGGGYVFEDEAVTIGWDALSEQWQVSAGYIHGDDNNKRWPLLPKPVVTPPPPPPQET
jgi:hypothetical protein